MQDVKETILVVDDEPANRQVLSIWLGQAGYHVIEASSGVEALSIVSSRKVCLVLLDVLMPEMSGMEVLKVIRKEKTTLELPIIMTTALQEDANIVQSIEMGANDYLTKPINFQVALARIEAQLSNFRMSLMIQEQRTALITASKMAALGQMASGIAHEIKNPLTVISGMAEVAKEILEDPSENPEEVKEIAIGYMDRIADTVHRVAQIITSIQAYSHQGNSQLKCVDTKVKSILDDTLIFCQEKIKSGEVQLDIQIFDQELSLECNPIEISEVLLNIIGNAIDAMSSSIEKKLTICISEVNGNIKFLIKNTGPEIPISVQRKLFNAFYTSKEIGQGTGLGMSISAAIVKRHSGDIQIQSSKEETGFSVTLPRAFTGIKTENKKILIIDDDEETRSLLRERLQDSGFEIEEAADGLQGWNLIQSKEISLVVTDYKMPNLDGFELAKKIREIKGKKPDVFVITGYLAELSRYSNEGYWRKVFEKPLKWSELQKSIEECAQFQPKETRNESHILLS